MNFRTFGRKRNKFQEAIDLDDPISSSSVQAGQWWKQKPCNVPSTFKKPRKQTISSHDQLYLDLGQKGSSKATKCNYCGFFYTKGDDVDERLHQKVHEERYYHKVRWLMKGNSTSYVKKYNDGLVWREYWKDARKKNSNKVVNLLIQLSEEELGKDNTYVQNDKIQIYVYISKESWNAVGLVLVEPVSESNAVDQVGCGIRRIWIARPFRRKQVATKLLEAIRMTFTPGFVYSKSQLYFGEPLTEDGQKFANTYTGCTCCHTYLPK